MIKKSLDKPMEFKVLQYIKNAKLPKLNDRDLSLYLQSKLNSSN